jgi:hypothetical protein
MTHAGFSDSNIDGWINNEANSYIRRLIQKACPQGAAGADQASQNAAKGKSDSKSFSPIV